MITIPLYSILFLYFAFLLFFVVFFGLEFAHIAATGTFTGVSFIVTVAVVSFSVLVLWATWQALSGVDWQMPITLWNSGWNSGALPAIQP